jgi:PEP-CTERM motif
VTVRRVIFATIAVVSLMGLSKTAEGAIIGRLDLNGQIRVTSTTIEWLPVGPNVDGDATGIANIGFVSGIFSTVSGLTAGSNNIYEKDLDSTNQPVDTFFSLPNFETFVDSATLHFDLTFINKCTACATGFTNSPFNFSNDINGTTVTMNMSGLVTDTIAGGFLDLRWTGIWTAQFPGQTIAEVLADLAANGFVETTFSASKITVTTAVPEPLTLVLFGTGTAILAARARSRKRSTEQA